MWSRHCCATSLELKREASGLQKSETQRSVEDKGGGELVVPKRLRERELRSSPAVQRRTASWLAGLAEPCCCCCCTFLLLVSTSGALPSPATQVHPTEGHHTPTQVGTTRTHRRQMTDKHRGPHLIIFKVSETVVRALWSMSQFFASGSQRSSFERSE